MGKSVQPPQTPSFQASAADQAAANKEAALWSAQTSNPNVVNPIYTQRVTWQGNIPTVTQGFNPNTQAGQQAAQAQAYQYSAYNTLNNLAANRATAMTSLLNQPFSLYGFGQQQRVQPQQMAPNRQQGFQLQPYLPQQPQQPQQQYQQLPPQLGPRVSQNVQGPNGFVYQQPQRGVPIQQPTPGSGLNVRPGASTTQPINPSQPLGSNTQPQQPQQTQPSGVTQPTPTQPNPYGKSDWEQFLGTSAATQQKYIDNYWNSQPAPVQALRNLPGNSDERLNLAKQLSAQGYSIDPQIMIEGQDPYLATKNRMDAGYTWTPSFGQQAPPVAPGLSFPGLPSYDPNTRPAGAIPLNLDFAKGLNVVFPWGGWDATGKPFAAGTVPSTYKATS